MLIIEIKEIEFETWSFKGLEFNPSIISILPLIRNCSHDSVKYQHTFNQTQDTSFYIAQIIRKTRFS